MTRLTNNVRESIAGAAVSHAFTPKLEVLNAAEDALAREAHAFLFPAAEMALVNAVPDNWFRRDECLRFNAAGYQVTLSLIGEGLPVPYRPRGSDGGGYYCHNLGAIPAGDLAERVRTHAEAKEAWKAERRAALYSVKSMLGAVSTIKKLREVWPEGEPFFKRFEDMPVASLPAVRMDEINAMLGISQ